MAVGVVLEFAGATMKQYDEVIDLMGFTPGGASPEGCLFHWVTETGDGFQVTDVWQSREVFDDFARTKIGPLTAQAGITGEPRATFYEVHNHLAAS